MTPAEQVAYFNTRVNVGDVVVVTGGQFTMTRTTRAPAQVLADGRAVVWLDSIAGAFPLEQVKPR